MVFITSTNPPVKWVGGVLETSPLLSSIFLFASLSLPIGLTAEKSAEKCREWIFISRHLSTKSGGEGVSDNGCGVVGPPASHRPIQEAVLLTVQLS